MGAIRSSREADEAAPSDDRAPALSLLAPAGAAISVQRAAQITGLSEHNVRFYERAGILGDVPRDASSGHRRYTDDHLRRLEMIACLRMIGMPLGEMRQYFAQADMGVAAAREQIALLEEQDRLLRERIERMQWTLENLRIKTEFWRARADGDDARADRASREFTARVQADAQRPDR